MSVVLWGVLKCLMDIECGLVSCNEELKVFGLVLLVEVLGMLSCVLGRGCCKEKGGWFHLNK
jgi:hypothetical protein